jgi:hypothetical protein
VLAFNESKDAYLADAITNAGALSCHSDKAFCAISYQVFTAVDFHIVALWVVTPCVLVS